MGLQIDIPTVVRFWSIAHNLGPSVSQEGPSTKVVRLWRPDMVWCGETSDLAPTTNGFPDVVSTDLVLVLPCTEVFVPGSSQPLFSLLSDEVPC